MSCVSCIRLFKETALPQDNKPLLMIRSGTKLAAQVQHLTLATASVKIHDTGPATLAFWMYRNPVVSPAQPPCDMVTKDALLRGGCLT